MEETVNLNLDEVITIASVFDVQPLFNKVIITLNTEELDGDLILSNDVMSDVQYVIAKGGMVREVEVADRVLIDIEKLMVSEPNPENQYEKISRIKIDPIEFNGITFGMIDDRVIKAKYRNQ